MEFVSPLMTPFYIVSEVTAAVDEPPKLTDRTGKLSENSCCGFISFLSFVGYVHLFKFVVARCLIQAINKIFKPGP